MRFLYGLGFVALPLLASFVLGLLAVTPNPPTFVFFVILVVLAGVCGRAWYRSKDDLRTGDLNRAVRTAILCFAIPLIFIVVGDWLNKPTNGLP